MTCTPCHLFMSCCTLWLAVLTDIFVTCVMHVEELTGLNSVILTGWKLHEIGPEKVHMLTLSVGKDARPLTMPTYLHRRMQSTSQQNCLSSMEHTCSTQRQPRPAHSCRSVCCEQCLLKHACLSITHAISLHVMCAQSAVLAIFFVLQQLNTLMPGK